MSRLTFKTNDSQELAKEEMYRDLERRIVASPTGLCPVDLGSSFIKMCLAQSCGKCVPCRVGLRQISKLLDKILDGEGTVETLDLIKTTAESIKLTADCAIGTEAANFAINSINNCLSDYMEHINHNCCTCNSNQPVACLNLCPAHVDIPGYISLVHEKRYDEAVDLIRHKNPFPIVCAYICEHPCENRCKRNIIDSAINIRGIKRFAIDNSKKPNLPKLAEKTNKKIAVIGGGPSGLSCAYYLSIMGHSVTVFEKHKELGGMLRYGIPNYRLPRKELDREINFILQTGITVKKNITVGIDISLRDLENQYDAIYVSIGAHTDKKMEIEGEDSKGVLSAVEMLGNIGDDKMYDFTGKNVIVVGGGNVAMDVARSSIRLNAKSVNIVYRRRVEDMTALREEIEGALSEGCNITELMAPIRIESDANKNVIGLVVKPQMISEIKNGRPSIKDKDEDEKLITADVIVVAIGQGIDIKHFESSGVNVKRGTIDAMDTGAIEDKLKLFAGGDCVTGPATVIRAIAAGRVAAANIDEFLGFNHEIKHNIKISTVNYKDKKPCGRVELPLREPQDRKNDFNPIELGLKEEEVMQECDRCLRCDHFGFGVFRGGRKTKW